MIPKDFLKVESNLFLLSLQNGAQKPAVTGHVGSLPSEARPAAALSKNRPMPSQIGQKAAVPQAADKQLANVTSEC
jgi:hypothetical protein